MKPNESRIPPSGWHFPCPDGHTLTAHDKATLLDRMFEYRLRRGEPTGTEEEDLDRYVCGKWPDACNREPADYGYEGAAKSNNEEMLHRISRWASGLIDRMPRGGYALVDEKEVQRRAAICRNCAANAPLRFRCPGCFSTTRSLLAQVRRMHKPPEGLNACSALGWDNATAAWLPFEGLPVPESQRAALPEPCWRR